MSGISFPCPSAPHGDFDCVHLRTGQTWHNDGSAYCVRLSNDGEIATLTFGAVHVAIGNLQHVRGIKARIAIGHT